MTYDDIEQLKDLFEGYKIIDLSHTFEEKMPTYPTHSKFYHLPWDSSRDPAIMYQILMHEHNGTHIDAPLHFMEKDTNREKYGISKVPIKKLMGPCLTLNFSFSSPEHIVTDKQIQEWEENNVQIGEGDIVIFNFGWWKRWKSVSGGETIIKHWPGLGDSATRYLMEKKIKAAGTDCLALDSYSLAISGEAPSHKLLLPNQILIIENLDNLDKLPVRCFFIALPLKIKEGSGSPIRPIALIPR